MWYKKEIFYNMSKFEAYICNVCIDFKLLFINTADFIININKSHARTANHQQKVLFQYCKLVLLRYRMYK